MVNFTPFGFLKSRHYKSMGLLALAVCLSPVAAAALSPMIHLSAQPTRQPKVLQGYLRATVGLHNIVGERDQRQQRCVGYGSASPDHHFEFTKRSIKVALQVRSRSKDTTLAIRGPNNTVFCADDSAHGKDAGITLQNVPPGVYQVWVGAFDSGDQFPYTLSIR